MNGPYRDHGSSSMLLAAALCLSKRGNGRSAPKKLPQIGGPKDSLAAPLPGADGDLGHAQNGLVHNHRERTVGSNGADPSDKVSGNLWHLFPPGHIDLLFVYRLGQGFQVDLAVPRTESEVVLL